MLRTDSHHLLTRIGLAGLAGAALSAEAAWLHMRALAATSGVICGSDAPPHCAACLAAVSLFVAASSTLVWAASLGRASAAIGTATRWGSGVRPAPIPAEALFLRRGR